MIEMVDEFTKSYQSLYVRSHNSHQRTLALDSFTDLLESHEWLHCQSDIQKKGVSERRLAITSLINELNHYRCEADVPINLQISSHCDCAFTLFAPDDPERLVVMLKRLLSEEMGIPQASLGNLSSHQNGQNGHSSSKRPKPAKCTRRGVVGNPSDHGCPR